MKSLSFIGIFFAAFLIFVGFYSRATAGVLSDAVIFIGVLIAIFVVIIWLIATFKDKKNRKNNSENSGSR